MYKVECYSDCELKDLLDCAEFEDWSDVTGWADAYAWLNRYVRITNLKTELSMEIDPKEYQDTEHAARILSICADDLEFKEHDYRIEFFITDDYITTHHVKAKNKKEAIEKFNDYCDMAFGIPYPIEKVRLGLW